MDEIHISHVLDLARFPVHQPDTGAYNALVAQCRTDLDSGGMFNLEAFLQPSVAQLEADALKPLWDSSAFHHARDHNIYFRDDVPGLEPDHPALRRFQTSNRTLCADQLSGHAVMAVYEWPPLRRFLADVMEKPALHLMEDPLARVNVMRYGAGDALNWHFDRSEFTVTLLLQQPRSGGAFEYRTNLRSADDPNYDGVARMLVGQDDAVEQLTPVPGTLNVFRGKNTAHRVTPVQGDTARVIAVFSYYEQPGVMFSAAERVGFYGRAG